MTGWAGRWAAAAGAWGAPGPAVRQAGASLVARYREPHRRYHTLGHLRAVLDGLFVDLAADPARVVLAAWFHDAVYDPRAGAGVNEGASAELAGATLAALGAPVATQRAVSRLIVLTADHRADPADADGAVLCDADLAILGQPGPVYGRYRAAVRREYGFVSAADWRAGRSAVLRGLLDRPRIYATERGRARWEEAARANLAAELARLLSQA